jgi:uncharacterized protein (TIGR00255 family)
MPKSMTGFATTSGSFEIWRWVWELRSVNGRGLDIRLRLPDWIEGLEPKVRAALSKAASRGNVTVSLRVTREEAQATGRIDMAVLEQTLDHLSRISAAAARRGQVLAQPTAAEVLTLRGVLDSGGTEETGKLAEAVLADLPTLVEAFMAARAAEGAALEALIRGQLSRIAEGVAEARQLAEARRDRAAETLRANLARVLEAADGADPDRVAQELALLAVKSDVTEELDRLDAHVAAARDLLAETGPVGRKFDFLTQEFNREANTLCSKAQNPELTRLGLDLKTVIDQMREQVQNME